MKEKTLKKIKKLLAKEGVEEDKIDSIVAEIEATEEGDENLPLGDEGIPTPEGEEGNPIPPEVASDEGDEVVVEEGAGEVPPSADAVPPEIPSDAIPPIEEEPQIPVDGSIEQAVGDLIGDQPQEAVPQELAPEVPPVPQIDPQQFQDLVSQLEELQKANEGLLARIGSLEEALTNAGVIEGGSQSALGDERPNLNEGNKADNTLDQVLRELNKKY